jgi:hypothetical protein
MSATIEIKYFNTFWIKKMKAVVENTPTTPVAPFANVPGDYGSSNAKDWYIEESRIRGGYNNTTVDFGVKAYLDESDPLQQHRFNTLIYSGIYNSRTGINNTNQFSVGSDITRSLDPAQGSIQKLYAEDTNLIVFQEDKVSRALIDKDAIYSAEGNASVTSSNLVIGQIVAYAGEYGIATDPFSFAVYGYRKYFTDRKRGCVLRLSRDGITEISSYGMHDFFRDELSDISVNKIIGSWDIHNKNYVISIQKLDTFDAVPKVIAENYKTLSFDESVLGWTSFYDFKPDFLGSLNNRFYSFKSLGANSLQPQNGLIKASIWEQTIGQYGKFYNVAYDSDVTILLNGQPSVVKNFKTVNYEGASGWELETYVTSSGDESLPIAPFTTSTLGTLAQLEANIFLLNFKRKENKFFANLQQKLVVNTTPQYGEVVYGDDMSGVKGFFTTVKFKLANASFPTTKKELFSISSDIVESSY